MNTYAQTPIALIRGEGCRVWDQEGRSYLDFLGGIAVTALGHSHPRVVQAIREQAGKILHTSNLYLHRAADRPGRAVGRSFLCPKGLFLQQRHRGQ